MNRDKENAMNDKAIDKTLEIAAELERTPNWAIGTHAEEVMKAGASAIKSLVGHILELEHNLKAVQINSGINFRMWKEAVTEAKSGSPNSCGIKNPEITIGDTIRCLNCNKKIILDSNTFVLDFAGEYIVCPSCGAAYDVLQYHIYGEKCDRKEE